jgi:hypothetical protein
MGLPQIKNLHIKGDNCQNEEMTYRMGKNLYQLFIKELISRMHKDLKKVGQEGD